MIVIIGVYSYQKMREKSEKDKNMKIRSSEDYYHWCCEWCDTENSVLWVKVHEGLYCGACHKQELADSEMAPKLDFTVTSGLC